MQPYKNLSGQSGVQSYEVGPDSIVIQFKSPKTSGTTTYKYSHFATGREQGAAGFIGEENGRVEVWELLLCSG